MHTRGVNIFTVSLYQHCVLIRWCSFDGLDKCSSMFFVIICSCSPIRYCNGTFVENGLYCYRTIPGNTPHAFLCAITSHELHTHNTNLFMTSWTTIIEKEIKTNVNQHQAKNILMPRTDEQFSLTGFLTSFIC